MTIDQKTIEIIDRALRHGHSVELKREQGKLVVVEIERKVKAKLNMDSPLGER